MNANKNTTETNQPAKEASATHKLTKITSRTSKMCENMWDAARRKPISSQDPRCQDARAPETVTVVEAKIDVGLGNAPFIRGQGNGLNWDKGQALNCIDASKWVWEAAPARERVVFKLLVNDVIWAKGEDIVVEPGRKIQVVPGF
jgi:hypothetical protein